MRRLVSFALLLLCFASLAIATQSHRLYLPVVLQVSPLTPVVTTGPTETAPATASATSTTTQTETQTQTPGLTQTPTETRHTTTRTATERPTPTGTGTGVPEPGDVEVADWCSQFDAPGNDNDNLNEEYVCFENEEDWPVDMSGWHVRDEADQTYTFPTFTLPAGAYVRLHTGSGTDTASDLYWGQSRAVWNNDGDTVYLYDSVWQLVDDYSYH